MRKTCWIFIAAISLLLAACQGQQAASGKADKHDNNVDEHVAAVNQKDEIKTNNQKSDEPKGNENVRKQTTDSKPLYKLKENWYLEPINGEKNKKVILVTIDDAPDKHALEMAKTLKSLDTKAIFFVNGHFLESDEKKADLKKIHDMGFTIGNHTYSHAYLPDISEAEQKNEILQVNDMVEKITGERPQFFRAPNGANTDFSKKLAKQEHMTLMNWSFGYDFMPEYKDRTKLTNIMLQTNLLGNGANLLMHDRDWTNAALKDIVSGLKEKGYDAVDPDQIKRVN